MLVVARSPLEEREQLLVDDRLAVDEPARPLELLLWNLAHPRRREDHADGLTSSERDADALTGTDLVRIDAGRRQVVEPAPERCVYGDTEGRLRAILRQHGAQFSGSNLAAGASAGLAVVHIFCGLSCGQPARERPAYKSIP